MKFEKALVIMLDSPEHQFARPAWRPGCYIYISEKGLTMFIDYMPAKFSLTKNEMKADDWVEKRYI